MLIDLFLDVERDDKELEIRVECNFSFSTPDGWWEPGDPEEFEILRSDVPLTKAEEGRVYKKVVEIAKDRITPDFED